MADFTPIQVPLINGALYSFAHIKAVFAGLELTGGFIEVNYNRTRSRTKVWSNSPDPVGKTLGQNDYTASIKVLLPWWNAMMLTIQQNIGAGYGDQSFDVFVQYNATGFDPIVDSILNCTFDTTDATNAAGTDPLMRTIDLNPTKILFNGLDDLAVPLVASAQ